MSATKNDPFSFLIDLMKANRTTRLFFINFLDYIFQLLDSIFKFFILFFVFHQCYSRVQKLLLDWASSVKNIDPCPSSWFLQFFDWFSIFDLSKKWIISRKFSLTCDSPCLSRLQVVVLCWWTLTSNPWLRHTKLLLFYAGFLCPLLLGCACVAVKFNYHRPFQWHLRHYCMYFRSSGNP